MQGFLGPWRNRSLIPPVECRQVSRFPRVTESWGAQVPVGADLLCDSAEVVPEIGDGGTPPEPVAVVDAVNDEARLENQRVRNHWIVLGIGVLLDVEILLHNSFRIGQKRPLRADRRAELL